MQDIKIDPKKVVFINLTEMDKYDRLEDDLKCGGGFNDQNGYGHEILNFRNDNGKCYGYTPPWAKISRKKLLYLLTALGLLYSLYGKYCQTNVLIIN